MSIDIQWDKISPENRASWNERIRVLLDDQFRNIDLPGYIQEIRVLSFDLGSHAPQLTIKHIGDPFPEFYEYGLALDRQEELDQELNDTAAAAAAAAGGGGTEADNDDQQPTMDNNPPPIYRPIHRQSLSQSLSRFGVTNGEGSSGIYYQNPWQGIPRIQTPVIGISGLSSNQRHAISLPVTPLGGVGTRKEQEQEQEQETTNGGGGGHNGPAHSHHFQDYKVSDNDMQILSQVDYNGDIQIRIGVNLRLDYPSQTFMTLPINLRIRGLELDFIGVIAYIYKRVYFSILGPSNINLNQQLPPQQQLNDDFDIFKNIRIESEIGDHSCNGGSVMKNVGKLEKFLIEKIKNILYEEIIWPSWVTLEL